MLLIRLQQIANSHALNKENGTGPHLNLLVERIPGQEVEQRAVIMQTNFCFCSNDKPPHHFSTFPHLKRNIPLGIHSIMDIRDGASLWLRIKHGTHRNIQD